MKRCNCEFKNFLNDVWDRFSMFDWKDLGVVKVCILAFGILLGIYGKSYLKKYTPLILITFLGTYVYIIYRLFNAYEEKSYEYENWKMPRECDGCEDECDDCLKF